MIVLSMACDC